MVIGIVTTPDDRAVFWPGRERSVSSSMCYMDTRPAASRPSGPEERTQAAEAARCPEKSTLKGAEGLCVRGTLRVWLTH